MLKEQINSNKMKKIHNHQILLKKNIQKEVNQALLIKKK